MKDKMTAKGVPKATIKNSTCFMDYYQTLMNETSTTVEFNCIRSKNHELYTLGINKMGLSPFENKRHYLDNVSSLAYGHKNLNAFDNKRYWVNALSSLPYGHVSI